MARSRKRIAKGFAIKDKSYVNQSTVKNAIPPAYEDLLGFLYPIVGINDKNKSEFVAAAVCGLGTAFDIISVNLARISLFPSPALPLTCGASLDHLKSLKDLPEESSHLADWEHTIKQIEAGFVLVSIYYEKDDQIQRKIIAFRRNDFFATE